MDQNSDNFDSDSLWDKLQECLESAANTLANLAAKQTLHKPLFAKNPASLQKEISHTLQPIVQRMEKGMSKILELLVTARGEEAEMFSEKLTEQLCQIAAIASVLAENPQQHFLLLSHGKTLQDVFGVTDDTLETLYQAAKELYEQQHYGEAAAAFSVLSVISPSTYTFWLGLGNSEYFCHNYEAALVAYAMAIGTNSHDPLCHFFSARCYEAMGQKDLAINALELALLAMGDQEQFATWKQRALEHKQRLSQRS